MSLEDRKYTISEFARTNGVTKHTLLHYEDIGLLTPAVTEENGYRYYINQQYNAFSSISQLKEIGLSLKEIETYLESRTPERLNTILQEKAETLEQEILKLTDLKHSMQICRMRNIEAMEWQDDAVILQFCKEEKGFFSRNLYEEDGDFEKVKAEFSGFCRKKDLFLKRGWGTIIPVHYEDGKWLSISSNLYVTSDPEYHPDAIPIRPEGYYLVTYHKGDMRKLYKSFLRVMQYAEQQNLTVGKFCFEEYVVTDFATRDTGEFRAKILIPVV